MKYSVSSDYEKIHRQVKTRSWKKQLKCKTTIIKIYSYILHPYIFKINKQV